MFTFTANAIKVLEKRYFLRDDQGQIVEDVDALFGRVARAVAASEKQYGLGESEIDDLASQFKQAMLERRFMPNSPTLMNAGKPGGQLSACFVLPVPDNLEGIFETCKNAALIHKTGGGTGFSFSRLRPLNDRVASSVGVASGPVSFMIVYDAATEAIRQGGTRRGANMGMLRVDHPDIEQFITCKQDTSKLNNFNISVAITDKFMAAVKADENFDLVHPGRRVDGKPEVVRQVSARAIFDLMADNAHATGEPGMVFIDRINDSDPVRLAVGDDGLPIAGTEDIEATNPCGEQPLGPGDACNLGSINLACFVDLASRSFDWTALSAMISLCVRFLDDVIDANVYPFDFVARATLNNRRIGLGVMGFADSLLKLGIPYDSDEAIAVAENLMQYFQQEAHKASKTLAESRGAFPNYIYSSFAGSGEKRRHATVTTIAPTGTISIIAGTSSGIEPVFAISYVRRVMGGSELIEVNPLFEQVAKERGFYSEELMRKIAHSGTISGFEEIPEDVRRVFVCAHDIDYLYHVRMQAAFQRYTDNAVSKTINFPHTATVDQVKAAYLAAWDLGLKGITVYRDASRSSQVLNIGKTDPLQAQKRVQTDAEQVLKAPEDFDDALKKRRFAGRAGTVTSSPFRGTSVLSLSRSTLPRGEVALKNGESLVNEIILTMAPALTESVVASIALVDAPDTAAHIRSGESGEKCPECGAFEETFSKYEACRLCPSCGYTKC
jgi:ribonucleoside-diphosphate reductase alpha chain